jgi:hypothetical protein
LADPACSSGDFTRRKEPDAYRQALERLLRDLKVEAKPSARRLIEIWQTGLSRGQRMARGLVEPERCGFRLPSAPLCAEKNRQGAS